MTSMATAASTVVAIALVAVSAGAVPQARADGKLAFEVSTIKLAAADAVRNRVLTPGPNRLSIPSMTLTWLIYTAYGDGGYNTSMSVRGGPEWVNRTLFAVEGLAATNATPAQFRLMLQTLLEERFSLNIRHDIEMHDVLTLVVDRTDGQLGPNVRKWDGTCPAAMPALVFPAPRRPLQRNGDTFVVGPASAADDPAVAYCPTGYRQGGIRADGVTMRTVADLLTLPPARAMLGTGTQDRTGLTDRYTLELDYFFPPTGPAVPTAQPEFAGPSLSTAVREQWGLRLVPGKGPLNVIIVESAQPPTPN